MKKIFRLVVLSFTALFGWLPTASHAVYANQCEGCHGPLSLLSNTADLQGGNVRTIRAANNPNYLTALITRPPPTMGGLVLANVNVNAIAAEIGASPNVRAPIITSTPPPATGTRGVAYSHTYTATGTPSLANNPGLANAFAVTAGALPPNVSLNGSTGAITGTPGAAGLFTGTVTASNFISPAAAQAFTINIANPPASPVITSPAPANGTRGVAYSHTYTATGTPAPTFSVTAGALPPNLNLNGSTGAVTGTPNVAGVFTGTVTASNGVNPSATQNFSINIANPSAAPSALENPQPGSFHSGIALFSGWSCEGPAIGVAIDGGTPRTVPYGSERGDTASVCGASNVNTGFGLLFNFNLFGAGAHTAQLFVNGAARGNPVQFNVVVPSGEFLAGASKEVTVPNFPTAGRTTVLIWQQSEQNFAIKSVSP